MNLFLKFRYQPTGTFARQLEAKIKIGLDHDFIGYHNKRSGNIYSSNDDINQKIRRYQSHNELVVLEKQLQNRNQPLPQVSQKSISARLILTSICFVCIQKQHYFIQSEYIGDEPLRHVSLPNDVKPVVHNKVHTHYKKSTKYQAIETHVSRNVHE